MCQSTYIFDWGIGTSMYYSISELHFTGFPCAQMSVCRRHINYCQTIYNLDYLMMRRGVMRELARWTDTTQEVRAWMQVTCEGTERFRWTEGKNNQHQECCQSCSRWAETLLFIWQCWSDDAPELSTHLLIHFAQHPVYCSCFIVGFF